MVLKTVRGVLGACLGSVEAESWLHAKQAFGFELSLPQARLVELDNTDRVKRRATALERTARGAAWNLNEENKFLG